MRIILLVLTVLLAIAQTPPPVPRQTTDNSAPGSKQLKNNGTEDEKPTIPAPAPVPSVNVATPASQNHADQNKADNNPASVSVTKLPSVSVERDWIDGVIVALNIGLLSIGAFGICAALRTLKEIKRQADLMAVPYQQWVTTENWNHEIFASQDGSDFFVVIKLEICNGTDFPLTLKKGEISFYHAGPDPLNPIRTKYDIGADYFLPPKSPCAIEVELNLGGNPPVVTKDDGRMDISVSGKFLHTGPLEKGVWQIFLGRLACSRSGTQFIPEIHMNPIQSSAKAPRRERPN